MNKYEEEKSELNEMVQSVVKDMGFDSYNVTNEDVKLYKKYQRGIISIDEFKENISKKDNLLKQYKNGIVDENEYLTMYELLSTPANYINNIKEKHGINEIDLDNCTSDELDRLLFLKLESEYGDMTNSLLDKSAEEIINNAYEITSKREIVDLISDINLFDEEKKIMLKEKDLLNSFYKDWLDTDIPLGDSMENTVEESISTLTKYYQKNNKENNDDRNK